MHERFRQGYDVAWKVIKCDRILLFLVALRLLNVLLVQTWFVPDEYWQSLEVAHRLVFGYGYLSWEWRVGIRSYLYPLLFALFYYIVEFIGISDFVEVLIFGPRVIEALLSAFAEYHFYKFVRTSLSAEVARCSLLSLCTSWFWWFCATRNLINSIEASFVCFTFYFYPWKNPTFSKRFKVFVLLSVTASMMRPTSVTVWIPLYVCFFYKCYIRSGIVQLCFIASKLAMLSSVVVVALLAVDRCCYGDWRNVHYNFLRFNLLQNQGSFYGSHSWHWYLSQGGAVVLGTHLLFVVHGMVICFMKGNVLTCSKQHKTIFRCFAGIIAFTIAVYSLPGHKEFRFILPILPCFMLFSAVSLASLSQSWQRLAVTFLLATNVPAMLYTGLVHQAGPLRVVRQLREELITSDPSNSASVMFLLPCHSTPYYSHLHMNISLRFLTCEPDLSGQGAAYEDEADGFYEDPKLWVRSNLLNGGGSQGQSICGARLPRYLVMYDVLLEQLKTLLTPCYTKQAQVFHSHFPEGRVGKTMVILSRTS